jgi:Nif11 domain
MSAEGLAALRARVQADGELARRLRRIAPERFADEAVRIAAEAGCDVDASDVSAAVAQGRSRWLMRWIR